MNRGLGIYFLDSWLLKLPWKLGSSLLGKEAQPSAMPKSENVLGFSGLYMRAFPSHLGARDMSKRCLNMLTIPRVHFWGIWGEFEALNWPVKAPIPQSYISIMRFAITMSRKVKICCWPLCVLDRSISSFQSSWLLGSSSASPLPLAL